MMLRLSALIAFLLGVSLLFAGGISFTAYGSVLLLLAGAAAYVYGGLRCREAGEKRKSRELALSLAWQDFGLTAESLGLGSFLFLYNQAVLPLIGFTAAFLFLVNAFLTQLALLFSRSEKGRVLSFAAVSGVPLTLSAAGSWQLLQGWLTLPEVEPAGWVKLLLVVGAGTFAWGWSLRLSGLGYFLKEGRGRKSSARPVHFLEGIVPALLFMGGICPAPLITLVPRFVLQGESPVRLADYLGMIWGGSGHYALYSPLLLAGCAVALFLCMRFVDLLREKRGAV